MKMRQVVGFPRNGVEVCYPIFCAIAVVNTQEDWKLTKPRMHIASKSDPGPDAQDFYNHVYCEHGNLSPNIANRRKISVKVGSSSLLQSIFLNVYQAVQLLQSIFPSWQPLSGDTETCAICDAEVHMSKEDKKEVRRRIEEEKVFPLDVTAIFPLIVCLRLA